MLPDTGSIALSARRWPEVFSRKVVGWLSCVFAAAGFVARAPAAEAGVRFSRDIQPILAENCFACHGPDTKARKANLRLDTKDGIFASTPKHGSVVVPGKPEQSELWKRIVTTDPDDVMPPPESHKELKPEQKEKLRQWIVAGWPCWEVVNAQFGTVVLRFRCILGSPNAIQAILIRLGSICGESELISTCP